MDNHFLFLIHSLSVAGIALLCVRLGKEALISWICLQAVLANLLVLKQIELFGWTATCSESYVVGSVLSLNLLQEFHGRSLAQRAVGLGFLLSVCFMVMTQLHLAYSPSLVDHFDGSYRDILQFAPRLVVASLLSFFIVQRCDVLWFGWIKSVLRGKWFFLRGGVSLVISQILDTVLFGFLGLYGTMDHLVEVLFVSFVIKCCVIALSVPALAFARFCFTPSEVSP